MSSSGEPDKLQTGSGRTSRSRKEGVTLLETIMSFIQEEIPFMTTIRISDLLDIAIVSFAIYQLLWILRKSSSGRVLKGIIVLIVAMALATGLQLTATTWVLNWVSTRH